MAYNEFSYFYDEFNGDANYNKLFRFVDNQFKKYSLQKKIIADLGCGTGEISLRLAKKGYDVLSVDLSSQMLEILNDKRTEIKKPIKLQLIHQDITALDLFGTIDGAVSTFDTLNHLNPSQFDDAIKSTAFFMEKNAIFIFDMNTPYKHEFILADNTFTLEADDAVCIWKNSFIKEEQKTHIEINIEYTKASCDDEKHFEEDFYEYYYSIKEIYNICEKYGLEIKQVNDGEKFGKLKEKSQRMIFVAQKKYTQNNIE